jgi:hypothetical protein
MTPDGKGEEVDHLPKDHGSVNGSAEPEYDSKQNRSGNREESREDEPHIEESRFHVSPF